MNPLAPVNHLIDKTEKLLGHSPHTAVVALPVGAWAVSNLCDTLGLATGDDRYDDVARVSMAVGLAGAAVAAVTGIRDYSYIPRERPSHEVATKHALGNALAGSLFTASYILRSRDHAVGARPGLLARFLGLAGGGLAIYTAWLGGVLVEEYGESVQPVMDQMEEQNEGDEAHGRERLAAGAPLGPHKN